MTVKAENNNSSPFKLKNPTAYHLLATQQQQPSQQQSFIDGISLSHLHLQQQQQQDEQMDFNDYYNTQQQFLSPLLTNSPPLQDFEDTESLINGSSAAVIGNMMIQPNSSNNYFFPSPQQQQQPFQESLSDYSSSVDFFSQPQPSSFLADFHHQRHDSISSSSIIYQQGNSFNNNRKNSMDYPFSAPAHMGYNNPLLSSSSNIGMAAFHQPPEIYDHASTHSNNGGPRSLEEYESIQINHQLLSEKKRRRRESHNAVERRRRENINERIQELGTMLPETMLEELASSVNVNGGNNNKPNKGAILRKSVDHIRILQQEVTNHKQRIFELERQLAGLTSSS